MIEVLKFLVFVAMLTAAAAPMSGCAEPPKPEIITLTTEAPRFAAPVECNPKVDPAWVNPPDADVTLSDSARIMRTNKQGRLDIGVKRKVCYAAIEAYSKLKPVSKPKGLSPWQTTVQKL